MAGEKILIVDDEESLCEMLSILLKKEGYTPRATQKPEEALRLFANEEFDALILDIKMPGKNGLELLEEIRLRDPQARAIMITAHATMESTIQALRMGASDYIIKPFNGDEIRLRLRNLLDRRRLERENLYLRRLAEKGEQQELLGKSQPFREMMATVEKVAVSDSTVLLLGASGTGKELIARHIHRRSPRGEGAFVSINCAALPETLLESELFGYVRGAFTGANKDKEGLFKVADGGTFFLDEVSETSPGIQVKLLRVLQEREIVPVGGTKPLAVDVRLISATNVDLEAAANEGRFRLDLFYRLNVIPIRIPTLKERHEDIPLLVQSFLKRHCEKAGVALKSLTPEALEVLLEYEWPGNVRELENTIERMVILGESEVLGVEAIPEKVRGGLVQSARERSVGEVMSLRDLEKEEIRKALSLTGGNKVQAARLLGIHASTLYRKMDQYQIE